MRSGCAKPPNEHAKELLRNGTQMVPVGERRWRLHTEPPDEVNNEMARDRFLPGFIAYPFATRSL